MDKLKKLRFFEGQNEPCNTTVSPSYQQTQTYPANNFIVRNVYQNGYMTKQLNHSTGRVYRHIESINGRGQATHIKYANGSAEQRAYQASTGWLRN